MRFARLFITSKLPISTQITRYYSQERVPKALRSLKPKSTRDTVQYYVDSFRVRTVAGSGGNGCVSFLSVWCKDHAGPDGGDGGHGGHVILQASHTVKSLNHISSVVTAKNGERGFNKSCDGKNAKHIIIPVPVGTIIRRPDGTTVGDLSTPGVMFVAARGGAGGRGNKFFLTDTEQAPEIAEIGASGESMSYMLEVRSMAHIGLVGPPNAGKSSLLRALSRARPKVAPYAFTTLRPHIGMVLYDDYEQVAIADLPGLIAGSHKNYGLGIQFLQHAERCKGLLYLVDGSNDPLGQLETLQHELSQYKNISSKPFNVVVNKIDLEDGRKGFEEVSNVLDGLKVTEVNRSDSKSVSDSDGTKSKVIGVSAKTGINLGELLAVIRDIHDRDDIGLD